MHNKNSFFMTLLFLVSGVGGCLLTDVASQPCDRECLRGYMTMYINAMLNHTPDSLPVTETLKVTEDCQEIKIGEGYWKEISGTVAWRLDVIDVRQGGIGALFVIKGSSSILYAVRLQVTNQKINQIETIVTKNSSEGMLFAPQNFKSPDDSLMTRMPPTELLNTREEMIAIASKYPEAMKKGIGSFNKNGLFFSKTAYRLENGQSMAGPDNIGTQSLPHLSGMVYKVALVDEEAGIVLLRMNFGPGSTFSGNDVLDVFEAFKVYNDTMHVVMAIMQKTTEGTSFGWDYDNLVGTVTPPLPPETLKDMLVVSATGNGISIRYDLPYDNIVLALYDITGKLVSPSARYSTPQTGVIYFPIDTSKLPPGQFIGCLRSSLHGRMGNMVTFPLNTVR